MVAGIWRDQDITANGIDSEWKGAPQYYNKDRGVSIRVANDTRGLYLCVSASKDEMNRQFRMGGLTIWVDPQGGKEKVFGIHLPGAEAGGPGFRPRPGEGDFRPPNEKGYPDLTKKESSPLEMPPPQLPGELEITYQNSTGPLKMRMDEVRRTGIDLGVGQDQTGRLVYEFSIGFQADTCLSNLKPGMVVGVGIQSSQGKKDQRKKMTADFRTGQTDGRQWWGPDAGTGMGPPGPGGGMPGGPGMHGPPGGRNNPLEIWLKVQLVGQSA